jgi:hypothetical protein
VELARRRPGDHLATDLHGPPLVLVSPFGAPALERLTQMLDLGPPPTTIDLRHCAKSYLPEKENAWIRGRNAGRCEVAFHNFGSGYP